MFLCDKRYNFGMKIPKNLHYGPIQLLFEKFVDVRPVGEVVPYYHFKIIKSHQIVVGHINLKKGNTRHITQFVGHVGYEIWPEYRGNNYAFNACLALKPFILKFFKTVIITTDPDNIPSIKTIEKLGTVYLGEVDVPENDPAYASGAHRKKRYIWIL